jgi:hypothetical protein
LGLYDRLPKDIRNRAGRQFALLIRNPSHPSVQLKPAGEFWSARVNSVSRQPDAGSEAGPHDRSAR